jgi:uncharacterized protein YuzE
VSRFEYPNLVIEYDHEANAAYIYINEGIGCERTVFPLDGIHVDLGPNGDVVGVEVLL